MLLPDWKRILKRAWSVRLIALAAALTGLEVAMPIIGPYLPWGPGWFALASGLVAMGALVARLMVQSNTKD